ncbi:Rab GTPase-binding effector protein 2, partial [Clarias magur]
MSLNEQGKWSEKVEEWLIIAAGQFKDIAFLPSDSTEDLLQILFLVASVPKGPGPPLDPLVWVTGEGGIALDEDRVQVLLWCQRRELE